MTLKQKIENLTWADLIKKLKDILGNFSTKFDNLTGRISTLESSSGSGGGGASQDLQSVMENGGLYFDEDTETGKALGYAGNAFFAVSKFGGITVQPTSAKLTHVVPEVPELSNQGQTQIVVQALAEVENTFKIPNKPSGEYTLVTTDDISTPSLQDVIDVNGYANLAGLSGSTTFFMFDSVMGLSNRYENNDKSSNIQFGVTGIVLSATNNLLSGNPNQTNVMFEEPVTPNSGGGDLIIIPAKSGTIALESPISGTFANPTSITVVNGIITAIS